MVAKGKVLLIDDDALILATLTRSLKKQGYEVLADPKGQDVPALAKTFHPDVVLLDIRLPGKSGIEILKEITESRIGAKVIMLTSDDTAETAIKAMKLGAVDYLTKPFNLEEVDLVVHKAIEKDRLEREVQWLRLASSDFSDDNFVGNASAIREIKEKAEKMAAAKVSTMLITGESGTGKEVLARHIHRLLHGEEDRGVRRSFRSIAPPCRSPSSRASSSDTKRARSPMRKRRKKGCSSWRTRDRSCSTRSAT